MNQEKIKFISLMKVFGVLIVILGHSMILYQTDWNIFIPKIKSETLDIIKSYINIFQMPFFVMISGYLFFNSYNRGKYSSIIFLIKDKIIRLLIPYFFVTLLWVIPIRLFVGYENYNGNVLLALKYFFVSYDVGHAWFMLMLFLVFILFFFIKSLDKSLIFNLIIFISFYIISVLLPTVYQIRSAFFYLIFFYIGYLLNEYKCLLKKSLSYKVIGCLFLVNVLTWGVYSILSKDSHIIYLGVNHIIFLVSSCSAIIALYGIFSKGIFDSLLEKKIAREINQNNFGLYLFHEPIIYLLYFYLADTVINPWVMVVTCFVVSVAGSLAITKLLRKIKLNLIIGEGQEISTNLLNRIVR